ncbi:MAG: hypothetical protein NTY69_03915 [Methylococcales bacterium]|nr:hypothetical protein [Methylococcales bacterium]
MQKIFTLPRIIAIPLLLIIVIVSALLFSFIFAILLIPMAIVGYKYWKKMQNAGSPNDADVIEAEYVVLDKNDEKF